MSFSVATAITRLDSGPTNCFKAGLSAGQKLQRVNEVIDRFYEFGTWRGLHDTITVTSSASNIITLSSSYVRLDALAEPAFCRDIPIKSQQWAFSTAGPGPMDWTKYCELVAIDMGDVSGVRQYRLTGTATANDARVLSGLARKRFTWITDTATIVPIDSFQALRLGVLALGQEDEGAHDNAKSIFAEALEVLNGNLVEFNAIQSWGVVQFDSMATMGSVANLV